jgi:putative membrane protein
MLRRVLRHSPMLALCATVSVAACSKGADATADSAKKADSTAAAATAAAPAPTTPAPATPAMTDASILGTLDADNVSDSTAGSMAVAKGTSASVKDFGRMMMKDHHAMRVEGMATAKKAGVTPQAPSEDAAEKAVADSLSSATKGAAWDKAFIDHAVDGHTKVLQYAQDAANATQNADIKALIQKATPIVQKHLDKAKDIQGKLPAAKP